MANTSQHPPDDPTLRPRLERPDFTPGRRDLPTLLRWACGDDAPLARASERALLRVEAKTLIPALRAALVTDDDATWARGLRVLGRAVRDGVHPDPTLGPAALRAEAVRAMAIPASRAAREAVVQLGKCAAVQPPVRADFAAVLAEAWAGGGWPDASARALIEAGGKAGVALAATPSAATPQLRQAHARAHLMAGRDTARSAASSVRAEAALDGLDWILDVRAGLEPMAEQALQRQTPGALRRELGAVRGHGAVSWQALRAVRVGLDLGWVVVDRDPRVHALDVPALVALLTAAPLRARWRAMTDGPDAAPLRFRLHVRGKGHQRALVWQLAEAIAASAPDLLNDPTDAPWLVELDPARGRMIVRPRALVDARFPWRQGDVPAASHPTVAAALVNLAAPTATDVVWDPFVGSGQELCECMDQAAPRALLGTDIDARAVTTATANLHAAGASAIAQVHLADARTFQPSPPPTLILTNPPLGRRVRGDAPALLRQVITHVAPQLAPGGRWVWLTPFPQYTDEVLTEAGLTLERAFLVDLGGFAATLQRWRRASHGR